MPMIDVAEAVRALHFVTVGDGVASPLDVTLTFADRYPGRLSWERDGAGGLASLTLTARLPEGGVDDGDGGAGGAGGTGGAGGARKKVPRIRLSPQKGVIAAVGALSEVHVDVAAVDAAFVIHADDAALIVAVIPELLPLVATPPSIVVDENGLTVVFEGLAASAVPPAVEAVCGLWHRIMFFLLGTA